MRFFDLFLRRAGIERTATPSGRRASSRLTVVCPREALAPLRKQIYLDFRAAGLSVSQVRIDQDDDDVRLASACITVNYPSEKRPVLMSEAKRLGANPAVHHVHFGDSRAAAV